MRLEHIAFNVKDVKALAAWYAEHLDMVIVRQVEEPPFMHFLADSAMKSMIEIYTDPDGEFVEYADYHPVTFHLAYAVDDMAGTQERLVGAGCKVDGELKITPAGDKLQFLRDPWGYAIQLVQRRQKMID